MRSSVPLVVRRADVSDAAAIAGIHVLAWQQAYVGLVAQKTLDDLSVADREQMWRELLATTQGFSIMVAAEEAGDVLGFYSLAIPSRDGDAGRETAEITGLYVSPERWRGGIGARLLDHSLSELRRAEWREVTLWVLAGNQPALALYERSGFERDGAEKADDPGEVQIRLRAWLV